jgi:hypothetical protein
VSIVKKCLGIAAALLICGIVNPVFAADAALPKLKMRLTNTVKNQHLALCLAENCYAISNTSDIILDADEIDSVVIANMDNMQMYAQSLPPSCKIAVKDNQLLTVTGTVVAKGNSFLVKDLNCSVVNAT